MLKQHYWKTEDVFMDKYARIFSLKAQAVYSCLKRHIGGQFGHSHIGSRLIALEIGTSLNTAQSGLKELAHKGFISNRCGSYTKGYYIIYPLTQNMSLTPNQSLTSSDKDIESVLNKEVSIKVNSIHIKEELNLLETKIRTPEQQESVNNTLANMRIALASKLALKKNIN